MREQMHLVYRRPDQMRVGDEFEMAGWSTLSSITRNMSEVMDRLDTLRSDNPDHAIPLPEEAFDGGEMVAYLISHAADHGAGEHQHFALLMPGQAILCRTSVPGERDIDTTAHRPEDIEVGDRVIIGGLEQEVLHLGADLEAIAVGISKLSERYNLPIEVDFDALHEAVQEGNVTIPLHLFLHSERGGPAVLPVDPALPLIDVVS